MVTPFMHQLYNTYAYPPPAATYQNVLDVVGYLPDYQSPVYLVAAFTEAGCPYQLS